MPNIGQLDKNLEVKTTLTDVEDIVFRDVCDEPFEIYGLYRPTKGEPFRRLPVEVAEATSAGVANLNFHTAGGRVRFSTDSAYVAIHAEYASLNQMPHMALSGQSGFDLYIDEGRSSTFRAPFLPTTAATKGYDSVVRLGERRERHFTVNFPLYNGVVRLCIGLQKDASLGRGLPYAFAKPVLYYGSSITQGGCACRPGNAYQAIISRALCCDHINLGFSGNARGEEAIRNYMASLDPSVFVLDYDHNAPTPEHLEATHEPTFLAFREAHPETPVVIATRGTIPWGKAETDRRREIIYRTYMNACRRGDRLVTFVDGDSYFCGPYGDCATVDGCHPNDYGFVLMARAIGDAVAKYLK